MYSLVFSLLALFSIANGFDTLVLLDNQVIRETHSIFFKSLQDRGHQLTFKIADDLSLYLSKYGKYWYQNLIIFAPSVEEFGGNLGVDTIKQFVNNGGNLLVAGRSSITEEILVELAAVCSYDVAAGEEYVIDHLNYDVTDLGQHTKIVVSPENLVDTPIMVEARKNAAPLLYQGTGIWTDFEHPLVLPLLTVSTHYSFNTEPDIKEDPDDLGDRVALIVSLQKKKKKNARVIFSGSLSFFSDEYFTSSVQRSSDKEPINCGNEIVAQLMSQWVFKEREQLAVYTQYERFIFLGAILIMIGVLCYLFGFIRHKNDTKSKAE